jgi:hypothetical protein
VGGGCGGWGRKIHQQQFMEVRTCNPLWGITSSRALERVKVAGINQLYQRYEHQCDCSKSVVTKFEFLRIFINSTGNIIKKKK